MNSFLTKKVSRENAQVKLLRQLIDRLLRIRLAAIHRATHLQDGTKCALCTGALPWTVTALEETFVINANEVQSIECEGSAQQNVTLPIITKTVPLSQQLYVVAQHSQTTFILIGSLGHIPVKLKTRKSRLLS